jgi:hypothetical protein
VKRTGQRGKARRTGSASAAAPKRAATDGGGFSDRAGAGAAGGEAEAVSYSDLSLHDLFEQQARTMLDRADMDEEQKQGILVAMACPCCGGGAMSYSVKLRSGSKR